MLALEAMKIQGWQYTEGALEISIRCFVGIPKSKSKKYREAAIDDLVRPTVKPDLDNVAKAILDALSGVLYKDDRQVVRLIISKRYTASEPLVEVRLKTWA